MHVAITLCLDEQLFDIKIDQKQLVKEALVTLQKSGKLQIKRMPHWYKSKNRGTVVSVFKTFEEEQIFSGDKLSAISEKAE